MSSVMRFDEWQDSNGNAVASGAGGVFSAPGNILQVVSTTKTDTFTTSSTSFVDITGLSATITPSSTSNKIMVMAQIPVSNTGTTGTRSVGVLLARGGTGIFEGDSSGSRLSATNGYFGHATEPRAIGTTNIMYLDSPNTTSATTYTIRIVAGGNTATVNRSGEDPDNTAGLRLASSITLMEVAG